MFQSKIKWVIFDGNGNGDTPTTPTSDWTGLRYSKLFALSHAIRWANDNDDEEMADEAEE